MAIKNLRHCLAALILVASCAAAQEDPRTAKLRVSDIEAELTYDKITVDYEAWGCPAINWSYKADWKDGSVTPSSGDVTASYINDKNFRIRNASKNVVYFTHAYQTPNPNGYPVVFFDQGQCAGTVYPDGQFTHTSTQTLRVWGRVLVDRLSVDHPSAKRGGDVKLTIKLRGAAPPSGTKVLFEFPKGIFSSTPDGIGVSPTLQATDQTLKVAADAKRGRYRLKAWTAESQKSQAPGIWFTVLK